MESTPLALHGIAACPRMASADRLYFFGLDSIPQQVADSIRSLCERFHTRLRRDLVRRKTDMKRNLLLEYSEKLAVKIANLCGRIKRMLTASCITIENKLKQDK